MPHQILDAHIHLYPSSELPQLAWCTNDPSHPLATQHSVSDYRSAAPSVSGFIFLETDRVNSASQSWTAPLAEISFLRRIVTNTPNPGEGHDGAEDAALCKAIVPWAPVDLGGERLEEYLGKAEEVAGAETWGRVKGFRYLLQDKPDGTAVGEKFVEGLRVLGRRGFVFDVGVDPHRRGKRQLDEAVEMVDRAHEGVAEGEKVVFILSEFRFL